MRKKITAACLCLAMLLPYATSAGAAEERVVELHVSVNGNDTASGAKESPLKTLDGARKRVRDYRKSYGSGVQISVIFHEGKYYMYDTVKFDENDTGYADSPTIYKAAQGENVIFSGAAPIDVKGFKKVTDPAILDRLPENSREKVGYVDLAAQGFTKDMIPNVPDSCTAGDMVLSPSTAFNDVNLMLDGEEQPLSQYPNGRYEYMTFEPQTKGADTVGKGGTLKFTDAHPIKWLEAKDMYLLGFFAWDYTSLRSRVQSIDTIKRELTLRYGQVSASGSKRWKAFNLLEEIDLPGEWYIDRENLILYYYPRYNMANSQMELSVASGDMVSMAPVNSTSGPSYITFQGINFENTRGRAFYAIGGCDNITIEGCSFKNIDSGAIYLRAKSANIGPAKGTDRGWAHTKDGGKNWLIQNNMFYLMANSAVTLSGGGNDEEYEYSNNVVRNNYFTLWSDENPDAEGVVLSGQIGGEASNNLLHNSPFHAINFHGQESKVLYNEVNNAVKSTQDAGAIYSGRALIERGAEVAYNLVKDTQHVIEGRAQHNRAIYCDDNQGQIYIHHNMLVDCDQPITSGGASCMIYDNVAVDVSGGYSIMHYGSQWTASEIQKYEKWVNSLANGMDKKYWDMYNTRFPGLLKEWDFYQKTGMVAGTFNTVTNNLTFNGPAFQAYSGTDEYYKERGGVAFNNFTYEGYDEFVDPQNYDYRIKKDSELLKTHQGLLSEDFDIDKIGIQWDEFGGKERVTELKDFMLVYPQNGAGGIERTNIDFTWQQSIGADKYHFQLSDTPDFSNILVDDYTYDNVYRVDELKEHNKTYYWRVTALNETRTLKNEWEPMENNFSFATSAYDNISFDSLVLTKNNVIAQREVIEEGTEPGLYKKGTLSNIDNYLDMTQKLMERNKGTLTQAEVDAFEKELSGTIETSVWQNSGFVDIGKYMKKDNWTVVDNAALDIDEENSTVVIGDGTQGGNISLSAVSGMSKSVLFGFRAKCDYKATGDSHWFGLGVRGNDRQIIYGQYNYFVIAKQHLLEYQIRSSGLTGIIETADNSFIKDGQWHDIIFGAYDCGFGQMTLLMVDDKVVFGYMDDTANQLKFEGCLTFYVTNGSKLSIKPYGKEFTQDFKKLVDDAVVNAAIKMGDTLKNAAGSDKTVIMSEGIKTYYANGAIEEVGNASPYRVGNVSYIPTEVIREYFAVNPLAGELVSGDSGECISSDVLRERYGIYVSYLDGTMLITDKSDFYMYNGAIPYSMNMMTQELKAVSKQK